MKNKDSFEYLIFVTSSIVSIYSILDKNVFNFELHGSTSEKLDKIHEILFNYESTRNIFFLSDPIVFFKEVKKNNKIRFFDPDFNSYHVIKKIKSVQTNKEIWKFTKIDFILRFKNSIFVDFYNWLINYKISGAEDIFLLLKKEYNNSYFILGNKTVDLLPQNQLLFFLMKNKKTKSFYTYEDLDGLDNNKIVDNLIPTNKIKNGNYVEYLYKNIFEEKALKSLPTYDKEMKNRIRNHSLKLISLKLFRVLYLFVIFEFSNFLFFNNNLIINLEKIQKSYIEKQSIKAEYELKKQLKKEKVFIESSMSKESLKRNIFIDFMDIFEKFEKDSVIEAMFVEKGVTVKVNFTEKNLKLVESLDSNKYNYIVNNNVIEIYNLF